MRLFFLLLLLSATYKSFAQKKIQDVVVIMDPMLVSQQELAYSDKPISWAHFKAKPDESVPFVAMTFSGLKIAKRFSITNGLTEATVSLFPYMDPDRSWYKPARCNDGTLAHEQRHFDITALLAYRLADELRKQEFTVDDFATKVDAIYARYVQKIADMQAAYDKETGHGTKADAQANWDKKILRELRLFVSPQRP